MGLLLTNPPKKTYIYHINTAFIGHPLLFLTQYVLQHFCFVGCYIQIVGTFLETSGTVYSSGSQCFPILPSFRNQN